MSDDPVKEYGRFKTQERRENKRHADAVEREQEKHRLILEVMVGDLSPAAKRIRAAAENLIDAEYREADEEDPEPSIPARLLTPPDPLPAGAMIESRRAAIRPTRRIR
jgi:hypothetical protein